MSLIAIIGPSGSGKSTLGLELALALNAPIVSLDSLSVYQELDIASAKPSPKELEIVKHYGVNVLKIPQKNNAQVFKTELERAMLEHETLLIVGGSGFYLKALIDGLSPKPSITQAQEQEILEKIRALKDPHAFLAQIDPTYATSAIDPYRTTQGLKLYFATNTPPSLYFQEHPKEPFKHPIRVFVLALDKATLHAQIAQRTKDMLKQGMVQEIHALAQKYGAHCQPFKAIGPKECLQYLNQEIGPTELENLITTHTCQLAKRQMTFNKAQFKNARFLSPIEIKKEVLSLNARAQ
ncbi:tRNA (adenosine(37)-N6)-dimethylallyltransferase MiaA [Helicobacter ailurogastricus]|uniref:tRNA dimethylallyltransferase n=1 Tax=Helicobacter ailurogastricus TaxID=1578720 RepID=A0A0K2X6I0_9HELI|nr:tRNA (adenosine(37)-N6)-dimethylallyltransferase MiaA [Helicobacter ailurogastricus]CRF41497.1 tRNA dimethylallyltransferase [Helicobacter ailurogastricus]CRF42965.1 tRNA dimethylallyltransferase [Helicobacter ailurogastricus]CRF43694.1 tRNA dimethylallyltransferase [Helicobacter ailurogastricus]